MGLAPKMAVEPSARIVVHPNRENSPLSDCAVATNAALQQVVEELQLRGYSPRTRQVYQNQIKRFLRWADKLPMAVTAEDVRGYLLHLAQESHVATASRN